MTTFPLNDAKIISSSDYKFQDEANLSTVSR
jgi:hypothetical protein